MNRRRDPSSPFGERLYFKEAEFESMMEDLRERAGPGVFTEGAGVDVDQVLLGAFGIEADYVDLPEGVLGRTVFTPGEKPRVQIARGLSDEAEMDALARRRLRTTGAHETGHVACHAQLFVEDLGTPSLFPTTDEPVDKILCRDATMGKFAYQGEWWEFQANRCMASLLMPAALFRDKAIDVLKSLDCESFELALRREQDMEVVRALSHGFDVSHEAVLYRLDGLGFVPKAGQPGLAWK